MGIFKDIIDTKEKEKEKHMESLEEEVLEGISFLDKNLSKTVLSVTGEGLFKITVLERTESKYIQHDIVLDKDHIFFLGKAMSVYLKEGNLNKLQKEVEKF